MIFNIFRKKKPNEKLIHDRFNCLPGDKNNLKRIT